MGTTEEFLSYFPGKEIYVSNTDVEVPKDDPKYKLKISPWHIHDTFENAAPRLHHAQKDRRGVFFVVNELDQSKDPDRKRTKKMFVRARAVWVEDDNPRELPREDWPIKPNIVVNSSPGKFHYYWLTSTTNEKEWNNVMKRMVQDWGCDNQGKDIVRVLRVPGFYHHKRKPAHLVSFAVFREKPYDWEAIKVAFPPIEGTIQADTEKTEGVTDGMSINELNEESEGGHVHGPSRALAMKLANYGLPRDEALAMMHQMYPEHHEGHHEQNLDSAYEKIAAEKAEQEEPVKLKAKEHNTEYNEIEWPPGLIGKMAKEMYEMSHYPNRTISTITAIAFVAGIAGRTYNVSGTGLNIYATLLMNTGQGKDIMNKVISRTLVQLSPTAGRTFLGSSRYTGPKALWNDLNEGMSKISIMTEAGILNGSTAGDRNGLQRALLNLFTSSGKNDIVLPEGFSKQEDSLKALRAPAMSLILESTPKVFVDEMIKNGGDVNGDLARMWFVRINGDKPYMNRKRRADFSEDVKARIKSLIKQCSKLQAENADLSAVKEIKIPEEVYSYADHFVDVENDAARSGEHFRQVMASRAWVKSVKIAAIIEVFNGCEAIEHETYEWVKTNVVDPELRGVEAAFVEGDGSDIMQVITMIVGPTIAKIINGEMKTTRTTPNPKMRKNGVFARGHLYQAMRNNKVVKSLSTRTDGNQVKHGIDKILEYMVKNDLLFEIKEEALPLNGCDARTKKAYKVTHELQAILEAG